MRPVYLALLLLVLSASVYAVTEGTVIQVSRKLRMSASEPPTPKDYYLDLGDRSGLRAGDILTVYRNLAILDAGTGNASNVLKIPMGELKVFMVGDFSSVARLAAPVDPRDLPVLDFPWVMQGDAVELKTSLPYQR